MHSLHISTGQLSVPLCQNSVCFLSASCLKRRRHHHVSFNLSQLWLLANLQGLALETLSRTRHFSRKPNSAWTGLCLKEWSEQTWELWSSAGGSDKSFSLLLKVFSDSYFLQIKFKFLSMKYQPFLAILLLTSCTPESQKHAIHQMFHTVLNIPSLTFSSSQNTFFF